MVDAWPNPIVVSRIAIVKIKCIKTEEKYCISWCIIARSTPEV